jgi:hypothetical protein
VGQGLGSIAGGLFANSLFQQAANTANPAFPSGPSWSMPNQSAQTLLGQNTYRGPLPAQLPASQYASGYGVNWFPTATNGA